MNKEVTLEDFKKLNVTVEVKTFTFNIGQDLPEDVMEDYLDETETKKELIEELLRNSYSIGEILDFYLEDMDINITIE